MFTITLILTSTYSTNNLIEEMTELAGPESQKKRRCNVGQTESNTGKISYLRENNRQTLTNKRRTSQRLNV